MSIFKRLSISVKSHLDEAVNRIENHDAVIDAALQESRDAIARLKLQQSRARRDIEQLGAQLAQARQDEQNWVRRAKLLAATDETQALACLERRDSCTQLIQRLEQQRTQSTDLQARLSDNLSKLEQKLGQDEQRLREFRGRDLTARAEKNLLSAPDDTDSTEKAFDRWELDITRREMRSEAVAAMILEDPLEERFQREEQLRARRAELKMLMEETAS